MFETPLAIGVDFGGTSVKFGVLYRSNIIDQAPPISTQDFDGPDSLIEAILRVIADLRARHPKVEAIGVGVPGFVNFEKGIVHNLTNVAGWTNIPLKKLLADATDLPVVVENDANCMTYAEWKRGAGRGLNHLVALTLGTGIGGGVVANGKMVRGANYGAGEVGQMSIDWKGRRGAYGNIGALEDYVGNQEIAADAHQTYLDAGIDRHLAECSPAALAREALLDDKIALAIWDDIGAKLATAIMSCCWLLNPQAVIIGGGVAKAGDILFNPLTAHLYSQLSPTFKERLMILPARFGNEAGMVGAAALALEESGVVLQP
ncbi:ROK family protein [Luteolibacter marinus]|uniref:ROK family protein n=1 Tax=Luteolibacter marinus TaxID=2776705 RepID=UPI001868F44A|nr:ROK family protein [Luteolibacter marinus]